MQINMKNDALEDLKASTKRISALCYLSWYKTVSKYQRTVLGPLWLVLSMAITIVGMGVVWSLLFKMDLKVFFPYLCAGMVIWNLLVGIITGSTNMFPLNAAMMKSAANPKFLYVYLFNLEQFILFFHSLLIFVVIAVFFQVKVSVYTLFFPVTIFVFFLNAMGVSIILGILGARFRDIAPIITSLMTLAFFVTPVMWSPEQLGARGQYMNLNPLTSYMIFMRNPMLGKAIPATNFVIVLFGTLFILGLAYYLFKKYKSQIVYWL